MIIGVIGGRVCSDDTKKAAFKIGAHIAESGHYLMCGGYSGVMEEACRGCKSKNGTTIGILMHEDKREMNPYIDIPIVTAMSLARNAIIVRSADILIAFEGSYGTLSEIGMGLALEKPIIGFKTWDIKGITTADTVEDIIRKLPN
ncbi:MAG: TIGR00725 family protein [Elusimicrobiota bacterium]